MQYVYMEKQQAKIYKVLEMLVSGTLKEVVT